MTPLLPTIGQDFGEVGQKSSDAALSNLLLKLPKTASWSWHLLGHICFYSSVIRTFHWIINLDVGPLSLSSSSVSGGKQLLQTQQTSTRPPNRLWAAIKYLLEHYVWLQSHYGTWTKGWGDKCRNKYLLSTKGIGLFVFTFTETLFPRNCSCSQSLANIAQASGPLGNILG